MKATLCFGLVPLLMAASTETIDTNYSPRSSSSSSLSMEPELVFNPSPERLSRDEHFSSSAIYGSPAGNFPDTLPHQHHQHHQQNHQHQHHHQQGLLGPSSSLHRPSALLPPGSSSYTQPNTHHHGSSSASLSSYGVPKPQDSYGPPAGYAPTQTLQHPKPFDTYGSPLLDHVQQHHHGVKPIYAAAAAAAAAPNPYASSGPFDPYADPFDDPWLPAGSYLGGIDSLHGSHFFRIPDQVYREKYQFDKFYISGTESYLGGKWHDCVDHMNKALSAYKAYKWIEVKCRGLCKGEVWKDRGQTLSSSNAENNGLRREVNITFPTGGAAGLGIGTEPTSSGGSTTSGPPPTTTEAPGPKPPPVIEQEFHYDVVAELQTFDSLLHETLCINKCKASKLGPVAYHRFKKEVVHHFHELRPYDYLQLCYYKVENYQRAASCAYTFLVAHPGHDVMSSNLQYYSTLHQVNPGYVFNLEAQSYAKLYMRGTRAYTSKRYEDVAEYMEESLAEYLRTEETCKLTCEDALDYPTEGPLKSAVADSILESLRCKQECPRRLSNLYGDFQDEFLASHFHYLQFAYYHLGDLRKACEATETYLLLQPYDQTMKYNKEFYSGLPDVDNSYFIPRKDIKEYHEQDELERSILESMRDGLGKDWTYKSYRSEDTRAPLTPTEFLRRQGDSVDNVSSAASRDSDESQQQQQTQARHFQRRGKAQEMNGPIGPLSKT